MVVFFGKYRSRLVKEKMVPLPRRFCPGRVEKENDHLIVIPETTGKFLTLSKEELRQGEIKEEVVLVGCGFYYEVWSPKKFWRRYSEKEA